MILFPLLNPIHSCDLGLKRDRPAWDVRITHYFLKVFKSGYVREIKPCGICCALNRFTNGFTIFITIFTILRAFPLYKAYMFGFGQVPSRADYNTRNYVPYSLR